MSTIRSRHQLKAFRSNFELALLCGIIVMVSDIVWLTHDIIHYGFKLWYIGVGTGLIIGLIGTIIILFKHNSRFVRQLNRKLLQEKKVLLRRKIKHK